MKTWTYLDCSVSKRKQLVGFFVCILSIVNVGVAYK